MPLPVSSIPASPAEGDPVNSAFASAETLQLLALRRSSKIAHLGEPGPSPEAIDAIVRLAARVPDHGKLGPWRFVVIEGEGRERAGAALAEALERQGEDGAGVAAANVMFLRAPACVMVVANAAPHVKIPEWEQTMSAGAACFALLLAAHAMGFAGCWLTEWPAYHAGARAALGLSEHERVAGFVYLGAAPEPATERVRADVAARLQRF